MSKYQERINEITKQVNESAREIWLAGLGAYARAQDESGKVFADLVKAGEKLEAAKRKELDSQVKDIRKNIDGRFDNVRKMAAKNVEKLESVFENQVTRVLSRLGVPTADGIQDLTKRVEQLSKEIKTLNKKAA